jgi:hypothetical protein
MVLKQVAVLVFLFVTQCRAEDSIVKALHVYGGHLEPSFSPSVFDYELHLDRRADPPSPLREDFFARLQGPVTLAAPDGHTPAVIVAPRIDTSEPVDKRPRLYVSNHKVNYKAKEPAHVVVSREELLHASFTNKGRIAYSLILVEVEAAHEGRPVLPSRVQVYGGRQKWQYILRVFHDLEREVAQEKAAQEAAAQASPRQLMQPRGIAIAPQTFPPLVQPTQGPEAGMFPAMPEKMKERVEQREQALKMQQMQQTTTFMQATAPPEMPQQPGFAMIWQQAAESAVVGMKLHKGQCFRTTGPLNEIGGVASKAEKALKLWQALQAHITCFAPRRDSQDDDDDDEGPFTKFKFIAARFGTDGRKIRGNSGEFGFGKDVRVGLRPEIATDAIWPLQEGVRSLSVPMARGSTFRIIGVRANDAGQRIDLPVIFTKQRLDWPVDVQFANSSVGTCNPLPGPSQHLRFMCKAHKENPKDTIAEFLAFCEDCMPKPTDPEEDGNTQKQLTMTVEEQGDHLELHGDHKEGASMRQVAASRVGGIQDRPWAGWTSAVPAPGVQRRYTITVKPVGHHAHATSDDASMMDSMMVHRRRRTRRLEQSAPDLETKVFEVFFTGADTVMPWESVTLNDLQKDKLENAGKMLSQAALMVGTLLGCTAITVAFLGLPNRLLAALPSASATLYVLQFFAILGSLPNVPEPVKFFCEPLAWLLPKTPSGRIAIAVFALLATVIGHAIAVCYFILFNGHGSAQALPHGLLFGSWELRIAGFVALPLASAAGDMVARLLTSEDGVARAQLLQFLVLIPPGAIILGLCWLALWTWRNVSKAIGEEQVVLISLPAPVGSKKDQDFGYPIFVDHYCDQLRAVPEEAGSAFLLGDWLASPGWSLAPQIATIHRNEHRGGVLTKASGTSWCGMHHNSPWRAQNRQGDVEDELGRDAGVAQMPSDFTLQKLGLKRAPSTVSAEAVYREVADGASGDASRTRSMSMESALNNPSLWTSGMYSECVVQHPIGVKTKYVYQCGRSTGNTVAGVRCLSWINIGVPAGTLCALEGHLQGEVPLRAQVGQMAGPVSTGRLAACFDWGVLWPWDHAAGLAIKTYLGLWVALLAYPSALRSETVLVMNTLAILGSFGYLLAAVMFRPYVHPIDNLAAVCSRLPNPLAVIVCLFLHDSSQSWGWWPAVYCLEAAAAMTAVSLCVLGLAALALTALTLMDLSCRTCSDINKASDRLLKKFAQAHVHGAPIDIGQHSIDVMFQDMHPAPSLPAIVRNPVEYVRLQPSSNRRGQVYKLPCPGKPWISVVPSLIFPVVGARNPNRHHVPIAAVTEPPDDGRLLFAERASNGGLEWREVVRSFLTPIDEACAREAERVIQAHEHPDNGAERSLVVVEICPSDNNMTTLIR